MFKFNPHISARSFSVSLGMRDVIRDVTIDFFHDAVTAVVGPHGCGKSTLLRAINRMNDSCPGHRISGELLFDGINVYDVKLDEIILRRRIGMLFPEPTPFAKSVYDNIAYGPRLHGITRRSVLDEITEEKLKFVDLWEEVKNILHGSALLLTTEQRQRLCLARALALNPEVLLLDDPVARLDPYATARFEEIISRLTGKCTVILATQNIRQAARISTYTAFFDHGSLLEYDFTRRIFTNPKEKKLEDYLVG